MHRITFLKTARFLFATSGLMRGVKWKWKTLGFLLLFWGSASQWAFSSVAPITGRLLTSFSRQTDSDYPNSSVGLEPWLLMDATDTLSFRVRALFDRPVNLYHPFRVPVVELLALKSLSRGRTVDWTAFAQSSALDVETWHKEGAVFRQAIGIQTQVRLGAGIRAELSAGPYATFHEFERGRNGTVFSKAGFLEQLSLIGEWGRLRLELVALVLHDWNGSWHLNYSTFERLSFELFPLLSVGISHQLLRSQIDEASGVVAPIGFFDGRRSRLTGFLAWVF
jgi:hypothetical protein